MDRVRVLCRVRPTTAEEQTRGERVVAIQGAQRLRLQNAAEYVGEHEASWAFDAAYDTDASQAQVYESIQPITQDVLRGFHATVFAYGQTGAGKTHSMFGPPDCSLDGPDAGVVPRLVALMADAMPRLRSMNVNWRSECATLAASAAKSLGNLANGNDHNKAILREAEGGISSAGVTMYQVRTALRASAVLHSGCATAPPAGGR